MDRNEFVSTLRSVLAGNVPASVVEENVRYYDAYISQEIAGGKSESEVLNSLGDPRLIAKTILDTQGQSDGYSEAFGYEYTREDSEREKGLHAEFNEQGGVDIKYKSFNFNTWYGRLLVILAVVLVLTLVFRIIGRILSLVLPVLIPVLLVLWLIRMFTGRR